MQVHAGASARGNAATTTSGGRDADHLAEDLAPIDAERERLEAWQPQTKHTGWGTAGAIAGLVVGGAIGAAPGVGMMRMEGSALAGLFALGITVVGAIGLGALGAHGGHALVGKLDGSLPKDEVAEIEAKHDRVVASYESALDDAEAAVRDASSNEERGDAWGDLMAARPEAMEIPEPPKDAVSYEVGESTYYAGYGVVPSMRYGG